MTTETTPILYTIKIEQRALLYIEEVLKTRPYGEVVELIQSLQQMRYMQDKVNSFNIVPTLTGEIDDNQT